MKTRNASIFTLLKGDKLLLQHKDSDAPHLANHWCFFGGAIEKGETPLQAVKREAAEELQIKLEPTFYKTYKFRYKQMQCTVYAHIAPLNYTIAQLKKQLAEGDDLGMFTFSETKKLKIAPHDRAIINDIMKNHRSTYLLDIYGKSKSQWSKIEAKISKYLVENCDEVDFKRFTSWQLIPPAKYGGDNDEKFKTFIAKIRQSVKSIDKHRVKCKMTKQIKDLLNKHSLFFFLPVNGDFYQLYNPTFYKANVPIAETEQCCRGFNLHLTLEEKQKIEKLVKTKLKLVPTD